MLPFYDSNPLFAEGKLLHCTVCYLLHKMDTLKYATRIVAEKLNLKCISDPLNKTLFFFLMFHFRSSDQCNIHPLR